MDRIVSQYRCLPATLLKSTASKPAFKQLVMLMCQEANTNDPAFTPTKHVIELNDSQAMALGQSEECRAYMKSDLTGQAILKGEVLCNRWGVPSPMYAVAVRVVTDSVGDWARLIKVESAEVKE